MSYVVKELRRWILFWKFGVIGSYKEVGGVRGQMFFMCVFGGNELMSYVVKELRRWILFLRFGVIGSYKEVDGVRGQMFFMCVFGGKELRSYIVKELRRWILFLRFGVIGRYWELDGVRGQMFLAVGFVVVFVVNIYRWGEIWSCLLFCCVSMLCAFGPFRLAKPAVSQARMARFMLPSGLYGCMKRPLL